jgi:hypothetical protein
MDKARMGYKVYIENLPRCDKCPKCLFVSDRASEKRVCMARREMVDNRVKYCPEWCPKRGRQ